MKIELEVQDTLIDVVSAYRDPNSRRQLTLKEVLETLAQDLEMTHSRPGSWEGSNMQAVINSHGFEQHQD